MVQKAKRNSVEGDWSTKAMLEWGGGHGRQERQRAQKKATTGKKLKEKKIIEIASVRN